MTTNTTPLLVELVSVKHPGMFVEPGPGLTSIYGYHAKWCSSDMTEAGVSVEDHGQFCEKITGSADAARIDGADDSVYVYVARQYVHGVIRTEDARRFRDSYVLLRNGSDSEDETRFLTPSAARSLAAILTHAANMIELL